MKKKTLFCAVFSLLILLRPVAAGSAAEISARETRPAPGAVTEDPAGASPDPSSEYYAAVWDMIDPDTRALLQGLGLEEADPETIFSLQPQGLLDALKRLFLSDLSLMRRDFFTVASLLLLLSVFLSFFPAGSNREFAEIVGVAVLLFSLIAFSAKAVERCAAAVTLTADFIKGLVPVYAGVIAFSGNPGVALQYGTLVFAYAQGIGAFFASLTPAAAALGFAFSAAGALQPQGSADAFAALLQKGIRFVMGAAAGAFAAVLSVRSVLAEAGDTVTLRGLRFLVGGTVPVVGSAIGDALNSLTAGLSLAKSGVGLLAILAVAALNLPALCAVAGWALSLRLLGMIAGLCGNERVGGFIGGCVGVCGTVAAALCFNAFVYIIAQAIVLRAKGGG